MKSTGFNTIQQRLRFSRDPRQFNELNLVKRGILYFISHRVLSEEKFREYKDIFLMLEQLTSRANDGILRQSEIRALVHEAKFDATFASQLDQMFERFSQHSEITPSETLHNKRRKARKEKKARKQSKKKQRSRYDENE